MPEITRKMGQSPSSVRSKSSRKSFRSFVRRTKLNTSSLSHTFSLPPSEEYPELMNINTATEEQLMTLPGVNRQLAREIVRHRQMIGRYKRVDDLALVSGIGAEKLESLRPEICTGLRRQVSRASSCTHSLDSFRLSIESKLCSVNSSSVFQLQCVPGLNQEIAANIVDYRNKKGPFKSLDDLIKVRGIDIIRLSTVKPHLSLDLRKCGSELHLTNGHLNGWTDSSLNDSILSSELKTPNTPHRKSFSAPSKFSLTLPNGFATAPVNDILDLLSAYSHRPIVEENFMYERDGVKCCRLATWNLHQLSIEKVTNPGVREVVCRTILENKLSLIAIQDIIEPMAIKMICEELNAPTLRRVREWRCNTHNWEYCMTQGNECEALGFIFENSNRSVTIEDVALDQLHLVVEAAEVKRLVAALLLLRGRLFRTCAQAFLICGRPIVVVNVQIFETLDEGDSKRFEEVVEIAASAKLQLVFLGEFLKWDNVQLFKNCESILSEDKNTTVDPNTPGRSTVLCSGAIDKSSFNGRAGVIRSGLCHLAIPRGWSWGGPASPYCPVWTELKVPD
ncbi:endonuclease/exonuclease/phosphatase family domain-containing protein 1-like [Leptidea sinapis]|uniref:endonuclease/exonuclease/phosphatase family domain-containing protein 1-like n=1 Tax=Leptidea sinapis TaxID=189913 RepID=UPI00212C0990|nr:endonuclease/exonuclease/phosphatase family domain-containing protein 1-like [Leptidea sinapis]